MCMSCACHVHMHAHVHVSRADPARAPRTSPRCCPPPPPDPTLRHVVQKYFSLTLLLTCVPARSLVSARVRVRLTYLLTRVPARSRARARGPPAAGARRPARPRSYMSRTGWLSLGPAGSLRLPPAPDQASGCPGPLGRASANPRLGPRGSVTKALSSTRARTAGRASIDAAAVGQ